MEIKDDTVYCRACLQWHDIRTQTLWLPQDNGTIHIVCEKQYPEHYILLGYDTDLNLY